MEAVITAIEYVFPENQLSNEDLALEFPEYNFSAFEEKVGIKNRYIVDSGETGLDLAVKCCLKLFSRIDKEEIDFVLYCTQSPEFFLPTTACILQDRVGLRKDIGALDFNLGCSGYTYGLSLAKSLLISGQANHVLLVTAETYSKYLHPDDRSNRSIFGDAASCTIISKHDRNYIELFKFGTDGSGHDKLIVKNGGGRYPYHSSPAKVHTDTYAAAVDDHLYMNGPDVFNFTLNTVPKCVKEVLKINHAADSDVDQFIFHQANAFMLKSLRRILNIPEHKFFIDLFDGGNTVSNTIPIALKKYSLAQTGQNQRILLMGFGVGLSWCGGMVTINNSL